MTTFDDDSPSVLVKTYLRPSTYRELYGHGQRRGATVGELLSKLADASIRPAERIVDRAPVADRKQPVQLSLEDRRELARLRFEEDVSPLELADRFGVSRATVGNILREARYAAAGGGAS